MFGSLVQKLQSLSPLTSPTTSPTVSPRPKRKFVFGRANRKRRGIVGGYAKEDLREVQSEPELDYENVEKSSKKERKLFGDRRKASAPPVPSSNNYPSISFPIPIKSPNDSTKTNSAGGSSSSSNGMVVGRNPTSNPYSSVYSGVTYSKARNQVDLNDQNIYEDVYPTKGPHVSIYNISTNNAGKTQNGGINVNIHTNKETPGKKDTDRATYVSSVDVNSYYNRSGPISTNNESNVSSINIYDNYKLREPRKISASEEPKSLPDQRRMSLHATNAVQDKNKPQPHNGSNIYAPIRIPRHTPPNNLSHTDKGHTNAGTACGSSAASGIKTSNHKIEEPRIAPIEPRKISLEPRKLPPPDYHRTMSSDYYQSCPYGYMNRVDEPYPAAASEDIYDVPTRIAKKVEVVPPRNRPNHVSRTVGKMEGIIQAGRLSDFEQYFATLLVDTHPDHPDKPALYRHHETSANLVCARDASGGDGELERIQELFPNDSLRLHDPHPTTQKMKGLMRKRSTTAARLQRAFSAKGLRSHNNSSVNSSVLDSSCNNQCHNNSSYMNGSELNDNSTLSNGNTSYQDAGTECIPAGPGNHYSGSNGTTTTTCQLHGTSTGAATTNGVHHHNHHQDNNQRVKRQFIMETPVQFTTGVQSQERHLFLFTDLLLVAKARSGGNFKLKEKVRVSEMWLSSCLEDVAEVSKSHDTSFVMGWPTTNVVASFSCVATKDLWYNKLAQVIAEEKESTPPTTNIQVSYFDSNTGTDICKTVNISSNTNARECINIILDHLEMRDADVTKFQLWVKSPLEESPYPLIGHEFPFAIKHNCLRECNQECNAEQCNNNMCKAAEAKCQFILRQARTVGLNGITPDNGGKKVSKKARKSPIRIHKVFKRSNSKGDSLDGPHPAPPGILFGHPLTKLFEANNNDLPKPVTEMLSQLFQKGPFTVGIFRKSANARLVKELREKLDSGCPTDLSSTNITAVAALFKEFLRSLPDSLLCSQLYDEWLEIPRFPTVRDQISQTLLLCSKLPRPNFYLLQRFLCILHHIARRSSTNMMSPSNLAVCVGPSLLWPSSPVLALSPEASKQAPSVMEFLIERFSEIFGEAMLRLMGEPPEHDPARQDSGAEESDSLHSGHSLHSGRRDDSSIDSLERDLLEGELSPLPRKDKMSLTNLSRDSGLTMSDTQLYTPDEEESESTSSGHSSGDKNIGYSDHRPVERVQHYTAPNNPNAIYTAVCRRPDKPAPIYDEQENYYATPSREHTKVHITYSTPSYTSTGSTVPYSQESLQDTSGMSYDEDSIYSVPLNENDPIPVNGNPHFQRDDWMRRKSNLRKVAKTNSGDGGLIRSTSEESLLNKYNSHEYGMSLGAVGAVVSGRRSPSEERVRSNTTIEYDDDVGFMRDSAIRRSRSAHYLVEVRREKLKDKSSEDQCSIVRSSSQDAMSWLRSRSTPHIQDEDRLYDSSTLSDDDSTPHVSRSNSRGKECGTNGSNGPWDTSVTPDSSNSRNSSFKSERTGSVCTVVSAGSCSTLASNPPSYEEALNRKSIMQQQNGHSGHHAQYSERDRTLYETTRRRYDDGGKDYGDLVRASPAHAHDSDEVDSPPPLPPKSDPPPLPPKQRSSRKSVNDSASRLKHLPPVHVETQCRKQKVSSTSGSPSFGPTMHKTIIYTDVGPPNLPPKERTVIEVVESTTQNDNRIRKQTVSTLTPSTVQKKNMETQTDEYNFEFEEDMIRSENVQSPDSWSPANHVTSVHVPDNSQHSRSSTTVTSTNNHSRSRARRRDSSASQRSRSVPSRDTGLHSPTDSEAEDWEYAASAAANYNINDFRNLDPELRHEISWSVAQLRAVFGDSLKGAKVHPPPYRPPPTAGGRAPITSYHLGAGDTFSRKSRQQTSYGEESYV